jgi:tRNA (guanine-N7-)-methyltransferase
VGKNKLARWTELNSFNNVIQPLIGDVFSDDHPIKGRWRSEMFRNNNPVILELGCGKGEYTTGLATKFPRNNYIGIDIKGARMWRGAKTSNEQKLSNVAFLRTRIEFINSFFSEDEVDEIWITFPDPHPGRCNADKRLTSPCFLNRYRQFLKDGGVVHLKTDNYELFKFTETIVSNNYLKEHYSTTDLYPFESEKELNPAPTDLLPEPSAPDAPKPVGDRHLSGDILSIRTHYENIFLKDGLKINYLSFSLNKEKPVEDAVGKGKKR